MIKENLKLLFTDKSARVLIVDAAKTRAGTITDVLKSKGFPTISVASSIKDAVYLLEVESFDWVISSCFFEDDLNIFQFLQLIIDTESLQKIIVTGISDKDDIEANKALYEFGALNVLDSNFTAQFLSEYFDKLFQESASLGNDSTKLSIFYFIDYLKQFGEFSYLILLLNKIIPTFPSEVRFLLTKADVYLQLGNKPLALATLNAIKAVGDSSGLADKILKEEFNTTIEKLPGSEVTDAVNILDIETCVLVDPMTTDLKIMEELLKALGVGKVYPFEDGQAAWEFMEQFEGGFQPQLLIQEWKIPKLTGPYLMQRTKHFSPKTAIILASSLLKPTDVPIVKEFGVLGVIEKPFSRETFAQKLIHILNHLRIPVDAEAMETELRQAIKANDMKQATELLTIYKDLEIPKSRKSKILAEFEFNFQNYDSALKYAVESLSEGNDSVILLNLLGKIYLKLGQSEAALKCLEKAQELSPTNISRLCLIAETQDTLGQSTEAKATLNNAKKLDPGSKEIFESEVKIELAHGNNAKSLMSKLDSIQEIIAYINNRAVVQVKKGEIADGLSMYLNTLESIPDDMPEYRGLVLYNTALAHIRSDNLEGALAALNNAIESANQNIVVKAKALKAKVEASIKTKVKLVLNTEKPKQDFGVTAILSNALNIPAGTFCCYKLVPEPKTRSQKIAGFLAKKPLNYKKREAIQRT